MANSEAKRSSTEVEETSEPPNMKTWVLRVSLHCEACERKVQKIIQKIEGVHKTDIDRKQQKVTVTGNIDGKNLLKRLAKAHKKAELWPQQPISREKQSSKPNNRDRESDAGGSKTESSAHQKDKDSVRKEVPDGENSSKRSEDKSDKSISEGCAKVVASEKETKVSEEEDGASATGGCGKEAKGEKRPEGKTSAAATPGDRSPAAEKPVDAAAGADKDSNKSCGGGGDDGGAFGKKKKRQGQTGKSVKDGQGEHGSSDAPASSGTGTGPEPEPANNEEGAIRGQSQRSSTADFGRPRQQMDPLQGVHGQGPTPFLPNQYSPRHHHLPEYPEARHYHGAPVYAVSYHTANPSSSYSTVVQPHYYGQPPHYAYLQQPGAEDARVPPVPPQYDPSPSPYHLQPSDSFELFSDENPNACSVM